MSDGGVNRSYALNIATDEQILSTILELVVMRDKSGLISFASGLPTACQSFQGPFGVESMGERSLP